MFFRKRKNEIDYTLVFNSMRLMVFLKNQKTLSFLEENRNLLSMNKEINQETNLFFTIPFRFDKSEFKPFINNEPLVYGVDYIEYSTNDKMVSPKIKNEELLDNKSIFKDIIFTCLINKKLAPSVYKSFKDRSEEAI
jgi:hypothetical protein